MVPEVSHRAWRDLITGKIQIDSSHYGFNLLLTTNRLYYREGKSDGHLAVLAEHLYTYMTKYEGMYQDELNQIFGDEYKPMFGN